MNDVKPPKRRCKSVNIYDPVGGLLDVSYPANVFNFVVLGSVKLRQSFQKGS